MRPGCPPRRGRTPHWVETRCACCMLWVTMTTVTSAASSRIVSSIAPGRGRVEGAARLVHQQHLGPHGQRAGDAQPLLLAAGQTAAGLAEPGLDLVPQAGPGEALLDERRSLGLAAGREAAQPEAGQHVVGDGHGGERVGLLEHHADPAAGVGGALVGVVDVDLAVADSSTSPASVAPGTSSCMRLRMRRNVDLPQPDGPISAVTVCAGISRLIRVEHLAGAEPGADVDRAQPRTAGASPAPSLRRAPLRRPARSGWSGRGRASSCGALRGEVKDLHSQPVGPTRGWPRGERRTGRR